MGASIVVRLRPDALACAPRWVFLGGRQSTVVASTFVRLRPDAIA